MPVPDVLRDLIRAGVIFETDGERIRWRNSGGHVTPDVIDQLRACKAGVVAFLNGENAAPADAPPSAPPAPSPSRHGASLRGLDPEGVTARKVARLPTHPPTCAACGLADCLVAVTDRQGRKLHVPCWQAEGAGG
ncbi:hypothetical protein [Paracoccus sp. (in: a-proteobacteria)]|uniref:hypothetical protein n=1 Tax=Paracoccus sp. TaxID=267 RepID=UPI00321F962F